MEQRWPPPDVQLPGQPLEGSLATSTFNGGMAEQFDGWLSEGDKPSLWLGRLLLSDNFYSSLIERAVPLSNQLPGALRGSSRIGYLRMACTPAPGVVAAGIGRGPDADVAVRGFVEGGLDAHSCGKAA